MFETFQTFYFKQLFSASGSPLVLVTLETPFWNKQGKRPSGGLSEMALLYYWPSYLGIKTEMALACSEGYK